MNNKKLLEQMAGELSGLDLLELRKAYAHLRMARYNKTVAEIARRYKLTPWHLAAAINGKIKWSPRIIRALSGSLGLPIEWCMTEQEAAKYHKSKKK